MSENRTRGIQFGAPRMDRAPDGTGIEPPVPEWMDVAQTLERWFAFVDVCGFTSFTERHGTPAALEVLTRFRSAVRSVTGRRGVRVLKWMGDGAMLVGVSPGPVIAAVCELSMRFAHDGFDIHAGIAGGQVLLFEGDDYIGRRSQPRRSAVRRLRSGRGPGLRSRSAPAGLGRGDRGTPGGCPGCRKARRSPSSGSLRSAFRPPGDELTGATRVSGRQGTPSGPAGSEVDEAQLAG
ncbi:MAG: hypothetical protein V9E94_07590 [Microthrixaceae bacterium]